MMKIKSNQTRIYDGDGYKKRAACLCFRNESEEEVNPGLGVERPEEEPNVAAVREVCEEAGVKGTLGRLLGIFENTGRKYRTYVYVLMVTEMLEDWEDSVNIGRKREWFKTDDASRVLHNNMMPLVATIGGGDHSPTYNINHNSRSKYKLAETQKLLENSPHLLPASFSSLILLLLLLLLIF
uniref:Nudix hydrolase domain-containing protein n=1 Tax=Oncorhynchus mykiss TaxID=8022 RepID=A0A8K9UT72_ONCMY